MPLRRLALLALALLPLASLAAPDTLQVGDTVYRHRWSSDVLHEYTPEGQDDLDRFADMLTLAPTLAERGPADLAAFTDRMAGIARERGGELLSNKCEAATPAHAPDCTLLVVYSTDRHVEIAIAKHVAAAGAIVPVLLSHREYGSDADAKAKAWLGSPAGQRRIADFIDWVDALGLRMDAR